MIAAMVNRPYPRRVQLTLGTDLQGPLSSPVLGAFDPRRDLRVYNDGELKGIDSFSWDGLGNRYLLFLTSDLNFDALTQVIHHIPSPPFEIEGNPELGVVSFGSDPDILMSDEGTP